MMLHNIRVIFLLTKLLALYLFITHPYIIFIFHKVVPLKMNLKIFQFFLTMVSKQMKVL